MDKHTPIDEGDLLAYLDGERLPNVVAAIRQSPELRQQLEQLRNAEDRFQHLFGGLHVPTEQDVIDVVMNQASPRQQLRVQAYIRDSSRGRKLMQRFLRLKRGWSFRLPRFQAVMPRAVTALRGLGSQTKPQIFVAAALQAQVTLRIIPPRNDRWGIEGIITQNNYAVAGIAVRIHSIAHRSYRQVSDESGAFAFNDMPQGVYRLNVIFDQAVLFISNIILEEHV